VGRAVVVMVVMDVMDVEAVVVVMRGEVVVGAWCVPWWRCGEVMACWKWCVSECMGWVS